MQIANGRYLTMRTDWIEYDNGWGQMARIVGSRTAFLDGEPIAPAELLDVIDAADIAAMRERQSLRPLADELDRLRAHSTTT